MELKVNIAGIQLEHPLMNGAGTCKLLDGPEGVREFARSPTAAIVVGSITVEEREGNTGEVYWAGEGFSLNSLGLPNPGASFYRQHLPQMVAIAHEVGKPLFVSVAGFNPTEYTTLATLAFEAGADLVELNLSCPNVWEGGRQKGIACFDLELVSEILCQVRERVDSTAKVAVKISPFSDPFALDEIADVIGHSDMVKAVTASNTFPNAFSFDELGYPRITPAGGLAGLGGSALKPIGLGQVKQLRAILPERIDIIGAGGITTGQDILDYQRVGARAVQAATAIFKRRGAEVFSRLLTELINATN